MRMKGNHLKTIWDRYFYISPYCPNPLIMSSKLEITNAGLKYRGSWEDMCSFARDIEGVIDVCVSNGDSVDQYNDWRPREHEDKGDIKEKTADEASLGTKNVEKESNGAKEDLGDAREKIKDSVENVKNGDSPADDIKDASKHVGNLVGAKSVRSLRKMEKIIYENIMLSFNPYYFDTEDFSVNLEENGENYILTINVPDEEIRRRIKETVKEEDTLG